MCIAIFQDDFTYVQWFGRLHSPFTHDSQLANEKIKTLLWWENIYEWRIKLNWNFVQRSQKVWNVAQGLTYITKCSIPSILTITLISRCTISIDTPWKCKTFVTSNAHPKNEYNKSEDEGIIILSFYKYFYTKATC